MPRATGFRSRWCRARWSSLGDPAAITGNYSSATPHRVVTRAPRLSRLFPWPVARHALEPLEAASAFRGSGWRPAVTAPRESRLHGQRDETEGGRRRHAEPNHPRPTAKQLWERTLPALPGALCAATGPACRRRSPAGRSLTATDVNVSAQPRPFESVPDALPLRRPAAQPRAPC